MNIRFLSRIATAATAAFFLSLGTLSATALLYAPDAVASPGEERRAPPRARRAGSIGQAVLRDLQRVQGMMFPEEEGELPDVEGAKRTLDDLRARRYDRMNPTEKGATLNLYVSYYVSLENYSAVRETFLEMLRIDGLRNDYRLRAIQSLGQLAAQDGDWQGAIDRYNEWRELSEVDNPMVLRGLGSAYYQLENYDRAYEYWLEFMQLSVEVGRQPSRTDYNAMKGMYFTRDQFPETRDISETVVILYDDPSDWKSLSSAYGLFDDDASNDRRVGILDITYNRGFLDEDDERFYMNLGQSLGGRGLPYSGAKVIRRGMDVEAVEPTKDNLEKLVQMYTLASMYEDAIGPARQAAELDDTGNSLDSLGYLQYILGDAEAAVESFREALEKGELENRSDTLIYLARSLTELKEYEEALEIAQESMNVAIDEERDSAISAARNYMQYINNRAERDRVLNERREAVIADEHCFDCYRSYPPIIR